MGSIMILLPSARMMAGPCLLSPTAFRMETGMWSWYRGVMVVWAIINIIYIVLQIIYQYYIIVITFIWMLIYV